MRTRARNPATLLSAYDKCGMRRNEVSPLRVANEIVFAQEGSPLVTCPDLFVSPRVCPRESVWGSRDGP